MIAIKPGDVVMLRSGGPRMTVSMMKRVSNASTGAVECAWFVGTELKRAEIGVEALMAAPAEDERVKPVITSMNP